MALNLLEVQCPDQDTLRAAGPPNSTAHAHAQVEAMRCAFADTLQHCGDPTHSDYGVGANAAGTSAQRTTAAELIDKKYAAARAKEVGLSPDQAAPGPAPGDPGLLLRPSPDTVYFCVVDGEGNACSFINSNYDGFGTGIAPVGCGFTLQNRGHNFTLQEGHVNCLGPCKRPYHTIIPGMATVTETGELYAAFGVMGGFMQPQGHVQVLSAMVDFGLDPQAALDQPRWCVGGVGSERGAGSVLGATVAVEEGCGGGSGSGGGDGWDTARGLEALGHPVERVSGLGRTLFGRGQIIAKDENGVLWGGSDPRGDGCALGF
jgi:gamma-glutamyltranspeptidase/glutathione hydrolase